MLLAVLILHTVWSQEVVGCPEGCDCRRDVTGRRQVVCSRGGMNYSIPIEDIDPSVEVLRISAPEDNENSLTIGPIFQGFQRLQEVHITRSNIPAIGKHTFWGVPTLTILNLTDNNITQVWDHNFRGLVNLAELYLDNNNIESVSSGTFLYMTNLRVLSIRGNRLKFVAPRFFWKLGKLHYVDLSYNPLVDIDSHIFIDVQDLRSFSCRACNLSTMNPHMYSLLPNLSSLDLGENRFNYLDKEAFLDLRNLVSLKLDGNHFPVVMDGTFQSQAKLEYLNLGNSQIAKITNHAFDGLKSLTDLDLSYNKLEQLEPKCLEAMSNVLRVLNVSGNNILVEEFTYILQKTPKLRILSLADTDMKDGIPLGLLSAVTGLKELNLSATGIDRFPVELLYPVHSLASLDLSKNQLKSLDERCMSRLSYVSTVDLKGNPFVCNLCHISAMLDDGFQASWLDSARCQEPPELRDQVIAFLEASQLKTCDSVLELKRIGIFPESIKEFLFIAAISASSFSLIVVAAIVVGVLYNRRHKASYHTKEGKKKKSPKKKQLEEKKMTVSVIDEFTKTYELRPLALNGKL